VLVVLLLLTQVIEFGQLFNCFIALKTLVKKILLTHCESGLWCMNLVVLIKINVVLEYIHIYIIYFDTCNLQPYVVNECSVVHSNIFSKSIVLICETVASC